MMPIHILPPQLANQIAAGEVVERPASVIKELIENSLDAGADRIDIDIERGGTKLIRIRDNGCGIDKNELTLALTRHATSKISSLDDLESIVSLGFRGEALASVSSVSRLTLTSRPSQQQEAWQAYAEGRDMQVTVKPAAHPQGTTVEVLDLFFNTPARRKFLRTEKTEFSHIDEVIRRIALARFDVTINLKHNDKLVRQYRAVNDESQEKRLSVICGSSFVQKSIKVNWQHDDLHLHGWLQLSHEVGVSGELQYIYVNGRMMRDRLLSHAIRQAYHEHLNSDALPAYVIYLTIDPRQVDVNVHPAKHEVRFHQSRLVHDFVYQAVLTALRQAEQLPLCNSNDITSMNTEKKEQNNAPLAVTRTSAGVNRFQSTSAPTDFPSKEDNNKAYVNLNFHRPSIRQVAEHQTQYARLYETQSGDGKTFNSANSINSPGISPFTDPLINNEHTSIKPILFPERNISLTEKLALTSQQIDNPVHKIGRLLAIWQGYYVLAECNKMLAVISLPYAERLVKRYQLLPTGSSLCSQPLLIPLSLTVNADEIDICQKYSQLLLQFGISLTLGRDKITVNNVPAPLRQQNLQIIMTQLLSFLSVNDELNHIKLADWLVEQLVDKERQWNLAQAVQLIGEVERLYPDIVNQPPVEFLQLIDLNQSLAILQL